MSNMSNMFNSLFGSLRGEGAPGNNEDTPYQRTQPNELRRTAAGRRADRQNTVESLIGPLESIALTVPLPDDPISEDWERKYIMDPRCIPLEVVSRAGITSSTGGLKLISEFENLQSRSSHHASDLTTLHMDERILSHC